MTMGSAGKSSPSRVTVGRSLTRPSGRATGPASASVRAYLRRAPARTSLASACVGTPKPGTSIPTIRTPLISFGRRSSGTPDAVGMQRFVMTMVS